MTDPSNSPVGETPAVAPAPPLTRREALARERAAATASAALAAAPAPAPVADATKNPVSNDEPESDRVDGSKVGSTAPASAPSAPATPGRESAVTRRARTSVPALVRRAHVGGDRHPSPGATPRGGSQGTSRRSGLRTAASRVRAATLPVLGVFAVMLFFTSNLTPASASDLGGSNIPTAGAAPMPTQTLAASLVVLTVSERDAFGVTDAPPPPPPPEPEPVVTSQALSGGSSAPRASSGAGTIVNSGTGDIRWPFAGTVVLSSGFGPRTAPCAACSSMHKGLDMTPGGGTPIGAVAAGVVRTSGMHGQFGQYAVIDHVIDGQRVSTLYAHMQVGSSPLVAGQTVAVGELVGKVGRSGVATGEHLHFEVLLGGSTQVDPKAWLDANAGRTL
jgi:hypothetical protein